MSSCKKCGECCKNIILPLGIVLDEDDIKWVEYHNLKVIEMDNKQHLVVGNRCNKLINNKCSIHKNRPENCQIYICKKSQ